MVEKDEDSEDKEAFAAYFEYNKVLRTWFVAFGVGGPALILVNGDVATALHQEQSLRLVAILFLAGAASQVIGSLINKISNWYIYKGTIDSSILQTRRHRFAEWLIEQFWIDIGIDLVTIVTFGLAVWKMIVIFGPAG